MSKVYTADEKLIASETDVTAGDLKVNDAYDLYLVQSTDGNYILIVFMKLQFFFKNHGKEKWTEIEKDNFINDLENAIKSVWGHNRILKILSDGKQIILQYRFENKKGGFMLDHWEITVHKIPSADFRQSFVHPFFGNVSLDSEDLTLTKKPHGQQRGGVHEFGHMLGLEDEYLETSSYKAIYDSIMNNGEKAYSRHFQQMNDWLEKQLKKKKIN
jgi:hypothetical protein